MATGNGLITAVAGELARTDLDVGGTNVSASQNALNDSLRDLFNRYAFSWRCVDPAMTISVVAGTTLYDTSAGGTKIQDIYALILDTGDLQTRPLKEVPFWRFQRQWANLAYLPQNYPVQFTRRDQYKVLIAPPPQSSSYTLKLFYSLEFVDITDFTATLTQIPQRAIETIKLMMLARLKRWEATTASPELLPAVAGAYALAEKYINELVEEDKAAPNLEFIMQGANLAGAPLTNNYWASPFVQGI